MFVPKAPQFPLFPLGPVGPDLPDLRGTVNHVIKRKDGGTYVKETNSVQVEIVTFHHERPVRNVLFV